MPIGARPGRPPGEPALGRGEIYLGPARGGHLNSGPDQLGDKHNPVATDEILAAQQIACQSELFASSRRAPILIRPRIQLVSVGARDSGSSLGTVDARRLSTRG